MSIERHDRGRSHYYTIDGERVLGVTTVISKGIPKDALTWWAARTVAEFVRDNPEEVARLRGDDDADALVKALKRVPFDLRDEAARQGTEVHKYAQALIRGAEVDVPAAFAPYVDAALAFMDTWQIRPVLVETVVASRAHLYAGQLDIVGETPSGRRILFDYKTAHSGVWPEAALQMAAYRYADCYIGDDGTEMPMSEVGIDSAMVVWLRGDATFEVIPVKSELRQFETFLTVLRQVRLMDDAKTWLGPPEEAPC